MCLLITPGGNRGTGHFYLAKNRTFLLCVDTKPLDMKRKTALRGSQVLGKRAGGYWRGHSRILCYLQVIRIIPSSGCLLSRSPVGFASRLTPFYSSKCLGNEWLAAFVLSASARVCAPGGRRPRSDSDENPTAGQAGSQHAAPLRYKIAVK